MGVPVVVDWWVSLRKRPPKALMVALVVNTEAISTVLYVVVMTMMSMLEEGWDGIYQSIDANQLREQA
jgi:hypothetical protein